MCLSTWSPASGVSKVVVSVVSKVLQAKDWGACLSFHSSATLVGLSLSFQCGYEICFLTVQPGSSLLLGFPHVMDCISLELLDEIIVRGFSYPLSCFLLGYSITIENWLIQIHKLYFDLCWLFFFTILFFLYIAVDHFKTYVWENLIPDISYGNKIW